MWFKFIFLINIMGEDAVVKLQMMLNMIYEKMNKYGKIIYKIKK